MGEHASTHSTCRVRLLGRPCSSKGDGLMERQKDGASALPTRAPSSSPLRLPSCASPSRTTRHWGTWGKEGSGTHSSQQEWQGLARAPAQVSLQRVEQPRSNLAACCPTGKAHQRAASVCTACRQHNLTTCSPTASLRAAPSSPLVTCAGCWRSLWGRPRRCGCRRGAGRRLCRTG